MTEPLDRYLDDFGANLSRAARTPPRAPRRRRPAALAVSVALVAAAVFVVLASGSSEPLDPVAQARAALAPRGEIVYTKTTSGLLGTGENFLAPQTSEQWSTTGPTRWRLVTTLPLPAGAAGKGGPLAGRREIDYARGVQRSYVPALDTLDVVTGYRVHGGQEMVPSLLATGSGDIVADLRAMLAGGDIADKGERQVGGRTVRRLEGRVALQGAQTGTLQRLVYDVDPKTFAPIDATGFLVPPDGLRHGTRIRVRIDAYRRIPITPTSARLLRIATTPRTKVTTHTLRELERRTSASGPCRRADGRTICRRQAPAAPARASTTPARP